MRTLLLALPIVAALAGAAVPESAAGAPADEAVPELGPIRPKALPDDRAVREAWAAVLAQARYTHTWDVEWKQPVPKEEVAAKLSASFATLRRAAAQRPQLELLLALGVAGRLAHNADVDGAGDAGIEALRQAVARGEADPRAEWLLGGSLCHGNRVGEGWPHVATARASAQEKGAPLPAGFWHDAFFCAAVGNMPAHQLEAWKVLEALGAGTPAERYLAERARRFVLRPALDQQYEAKTTARARKDGTRVWITSRVCGFRFAIDGARELRMPPVQKGMCVVESYAGPFQGNEQVSPGIFVFARAAREGEPPDALLDMAAPPAKRTAAKDFPCAFPGCRAFELRNAETYEKEGGGLAVVLAFTRDEPAFPGLAFEEPVVARGPPGETSYTAFEPELGRFPGRISYVVVLDTAVSVAPQAKEELRRFLADFSAE